MFTKTLCAAAVAGFFAVGATPASAACGATLNGVPMSPEMCAAAIQAYGRVQPGHYWMDEHGTWGRMGSPFPEGNLFVDARRATSGGSSYIDRGTFGTTGGDGSCSYYNDPETGASVMTGNC